MRIGIDLDGVVANFTKGWTTKYKEEFEKKGLIFSAISPDGTLPEIIELKNHPWFVGVQFHPEFKSRPFTPHPLFNGELIVTSTLMMPPDSLKIT